MSMLTIHLRSPIRLSTEPAPCAEGCGLDPEGGEHSTTAEECFGKLGKGCHDPSAHHAYRPITWWLRRVRFRLGGWWP